MRLSHSLLSILLVCIGFMDVLARIPPSQRKFSSIAVESVISQFVPRFTDPEIGTIFENCFPNTLDTTVQSFVESPANSFIITGDIHAQWLRDSTNQVLPYIPLARNDTHLRNLICGLIHRQSADVLHDAFANAFNFADDGGPNQGDQRHPPMTPHVFEGKYELDSLAAALKLANAYFNWTQDGSCFADSNFLPAVKLIIATVKRMQAGTAEEGTQPSYTFQRTTPVATDTLQLQGRGPVAMRCGLSKCLFRPSDDAVSLPFLIPANAMMSVELSRLAAMLNISGQPMYSAELSGEASALATEIRTAIFQHGVVKHSVYGRMFAYEVDGAGGAILMDDANIPSLLSLPYLGFISHDDPIYQNTRRFLLSTSNPFFFQGSAGEGIGGPHIGMFYIWPMSIMMRALTSSDETEIRFCLTMLKSSTAGTGFMHESFWKDDPSQYTRSWFAWANSLFGELILTLAQERPGLIFSK